MRRGERLPIGEFNGDPRSGKGSAVKAIVAAHPGRVVSLETGAGYRAITKGFLDTGKITPDMPRDVISKRLAAASFELISFYAARRDHFIEEEGLASLYTSDVQDTVSAVSPVPQVRRAVKADFVRRVELVRDNPTIDALVVDGRNLQAVLENVPDTEVHLRVYTTCTPEEAAFRECLDKDIDPLSSEGEAVLAGIRRRIKEDAERAADPVKPDDDPLVFWEYVRRLSLPNGEVQDRDQPVTYLGVRAIAAEAIKQQQQVLFDTTRYRQDHPDRPKEAMGEDINALFDEAFALAA